MPAGTQRLSLARRTMGLGRALGARALVAAYALAALVAAFLPLTDHLGFELALLLGIVAAGVAPATGMAAMRLDEARPRAEREPLRAATAAALFAAIALLVPALIILLNGLRRPACDPWRGGVWLLLLPVPTAILAAALGAAARAWTRSTGRGVAIVAAVEIASLASNAGSVYLGPTFFFYDHFFGYWPGPIYDETLHVSAPLVVFRLMTVLWAVVGILACGRAAPERATARRSTIRSLLLAVALLITGFGFGAQLGYRSTYRSVANALGGEKRVDDLDLHYPREWPREQVDEFVRDARFRAFQVEQALEVHPRFTVTVFMFRSAEEKRRLVGAAETSFTKPWLHQVDVQWEGYPSPVLRHELVHAFAAAFGTGPFKVPGGLLPNAPLTEGLAVAFDAQPRGMTRLEWAKAMRDDHLAPDLGALFGSTGFYAAAPARAYAYAGAFVQYLAGRFGIAAIKRLYATGDLSTLGDPRRIVADFEARLDAISLTPSEIAAAERRFRRASIFHRACPHEVATVTSRAYDELDRNDNAKALSFFDAACRLDPDDPALARNRLTAALRTGDPGLIARATTDLFSRPNLDPPLRASALIELGDAAWKTQDLSHAASDYAQAARLNLDPATHRSAVAHLEAVQDPARAALLRPLLVDGDADAGELFAMNDYLARRPLDALVTYLLGRQLVFQHAVGRGLALLAGLTPSAIGDEEIAREAWRLEVRARAELHECAPVEPLALAQGRFFPADRAFAEDWQERCAFEVAKGLPPLSR